MPQARTNQPSSRVRAQALALDALDDRGVPMWLRTAQILACCSLIMGTINVLQHTTQGSPWPGFDRSSPTAALTHPTAFGHIANLAQPGLATMEIIVRRNDTLDSIFRRLQLNVADLASVRSLDQARGGLDRLVPGEHVRVVASKGSLVGLERQVSPTQTLTVRRIGDAFDATLVAKPIVQATHLAQGTISSSLFESATAAGLSEANVLRLAKIFGTDVDFVLGLRRGESFSVLYQRSESDGRSVKDGDILAARFVNQGHVFEAVRYIGADGEAHYYSPDGRIMEKTFLRAPLAFERVSSGFSSARFHPILHRIRAHHGVDYAAPAGTPVYAAGAGRITYRARKGGLGNVVEIDHGRSIETVYGHLRAFANIRVGESVRQGQLIGYVGQTGLATGPHLHYEFHINGVYVNPQTVKLVQSVPISPAHRAQFLAATAPLLAALDHPISPTYVASLR